MNQDLKVVHHYDKFIASLLKDSPAETQRSVRNLLTWVDHADQSGSRRFARGFFPIPIRRRFMQGENLKSARDMVRYHLTNGHDPQYVSDVIASHVSRGRLDNDTLPEILPTFSSMNPDHADALAAELHEGLSAATFKKEDVPPIFSIIHPLSQTGQDPSPTLQQIRWAMESKRFKSDLLQSSAPFLADVAKAGHDTSDLARDILGGAGDGYINKQNMADILDILHDTAKKGHNPETLALLLRSGLSTRGFKNKNLRKTAAEIEKAFDLCRKNDISIVEVGQPLFDGIRFGEFHDDNIAHIAEPMARLIVLANKKGHLNYLSNNLSDSVIPGETFPKLVSACIHTANVGYAPSKLLHSNNNMRLTLGKHNLITEHSRFAKVLHDVAKGRHDTHNFCDALSKNIQNKTFSARNLRDVLSLAGKVASHGADPAPAVELLARGYKQGRLSGADFEKFTEIVSDKTPLKGHNPGDLITHGIGAHIDYSIPVDKIPEYQRTFLNKGHFPTKELMHRYHTRSPIHKR